MLRLLRKPLRSSSPRAFSSFSPTTKMPNSKLIDPQNPSPRPILSPKPSLSLLSSPKPPSFYALSATLIAAIAASAASAALLSTGDPQIKEKAQGLYSDLEQSLGRSGDSVRRVFDRMKQTGVAATMLWKSLRSVLSSANQEVRSGFELRVAALLADIAAANESRRSAIVSAGGGAVVDWLLETVSSAGDGTQAESARALAHLIADPKVCEDVLGRPHAVPNLMRFIFSFQPKRSKKVSFDLISFPNSQLDDFLITSTFHVVID